MKTSIVIIAIAIIAGVFTTIYSAQFSWGLTLAILAGFFLPFIVVKSMWQEACPEDIYETIAIISSATAVMLIGAIIPLAVWGYPLFEVPTILNVYGISICWSMWLALTMLIIKERLPKGILRWIIGSAYVMWTSISLATVCTEVCQSILGYIVIGTLIVFIISFIIWGYKIITLLKKY